MRGDQNSNGGENTDEQRDIGNTIGEVTSTALRRFEKFVLDKSPWLFAALAVTTIFTVFLFGFYSNIRKGFAPLLDPLFAANLSLQLSMLAAAWGLVMRVAPYLEYFAVSVASISRDRRFSELLRSFARGFANLILQPLLLFAALSAFLDFATALKFSALLCFWGVFVFGPFLYISEFARNRGRTRKEVFFAILDIFRARNALSTYKSMPVIIIGLCLVLSYHLGSLKFRSIARADKVYVVAGGGCISGALLGATASGIVIVRREPEKKKFVSKFGGVYLPFSAVVSIDSIDPNKQCEDISEAK